MKPSDFANQSEVLKLGQTKSVTVDGFDQDGNPFLETMPAFEVTSDNPKVTSVSGSSVSSIAVGDANLTAKLKGPKGELSDGVKVTNVTAVQELTTIKIRLTDSSPAVAKPAKVPAATPASPGWGK